MKHRRIITRQSSTPRGMDIVGPAADQNSISLSADIAVAAIGWFKVAEVPIGSPE